MSLVAVDGVHYLQLAMGACVPCDNGFRDLTAILRRKAEAPHALTSVNEREGKPYLTT